MYSDVFMSLILQLFKFITSLSLYLFIFANHYVDSIKLYQWLVNLIFKSHPMVIEHINNLDSSS